MAASLEEILARRLEPDNDTIEKATADLKKVFNDPSTLQLLYQILGTSSKPEIRQYAAVLIRKKILKSKQWLDLDDTFKNEMREGLLKLSVQEPEKSARAAIAQIIAIMARHDTPTGSWPVLYEFIFGLVKDGDPDKKEKGMFLLSTITGSAVKQMKPVMVSVLTHLARALNESVNTEVSYLAIKSLRNLVFCIKDHSDLKPLQTVVPRVLEVLQELTTQDEEKACGALEFLQALLEVEVTIIEPHLKVLVEYSLQVASNKDYTDILRVKALLFISTMIQSKMKILLKHRLIDPIMQSLLSIIGDDEGENIVDEEETDEVKALESQRPSQFAVEIFDVVGHHLPADKLLSKLMPMLERCVASKAAAHRRTTHLVMATIVEDCGEFATDSMLSQMVQAVCAGLKDSSHLVRTAALFAVGHFAQYLQADMLSHASTLLPLVFTCLNKSIEEKNPEGLAKSRFALRKCCEHLDDEILPYLPDLMSYVLNALQTSNSTPIKEFAIGSVGMAVSAVQENMSPFFNDVLEHLKTYLACNVEDEDAKRLQLTCIVTMSSLAVNIGEETFGPVAKDCLDLGLNLLNSATDPDLRRYVYSLFSAISTTVKEDMADYLERIVKFMLTSVTSTEGIKDQHTYKTDEVSMFGADELDEEEKADDKEGKELEEFYLENAYVDEKKGACLALGEIAKNCGSSFWPYLQQSYSDVHELMTYPADSVKKAAFGSLSQFCLSMHNFNKEKQSAETAEALDRMIVGVVPKYLESIKTELEPTLVMEAVVSIQELLNKIGEPVLSNTGATEAILTVAKDILSFKVPCQNDEEGDGVDDEAEFDSMLRGSARDILRQTGHIIGAEKLVPFFTNFVEDSRKRLTSKSASNEDDKALALGTLAEIIKACGEPLGAAFASQLHPIFVRLVFDKDDAVRNNAIFATGVLAVNGGPGMAKCYPEILKTFSGVMNRECNPLVLDNVCGAVCRMIHHSPKLVPVAQVFPFVMELLPLKEDMDENLSVFTCFEKLYGETSPKAPFLIDLHKLVQFIPKLLNVAVEVARSGDVKKDTKKVLAQFVKNVKQNYPSKFDAVRASIDPEAGSVLDICIDAVFSS